MACFKIQPFPSQSISHQAIVLSDTHVNDLTCCSKYVIKLKVIQDTIAGTKDWTWIVND